MKEHFINLNFLIKYAVLIKMEKYHINMSPKNQVKIQMNINIGFREKNVYGMTFQEYMMTTAIHFIEKE
jgi:hypothetical protein